jgi:DNA-binding GntR family transcriptional regulator
MEDGSPRDPRTCMRIAAAIRDQITSGQLRPGHPVPSITILSRDHTTSRGTAGKAARLLEREGLIFRVPGLSYHVDTGQAQRQGDRSPGRAQPGC